MCTVSFLPKGKNSFILTSNRDEKSSRAAAIFPSEISSGKETIVFPKDPDGGGSWIAASTSGKIVCLLNGAFYKHMPAPYYKKSRGIVLLDVLTYDTMEDFAVDYDLGSIAPFTLVSWMNGVLMEFRWDGSEIYMITLDPAKPYIWSSVTLYSEEVIENRNSWFYHWLNKNSGQTLSQIRKFHHDGGDGNKENDLTMNRENELYTMSITSMVKKDKSIQVIYEDLVTKEKKRLRLRLNSGTEKKKTKSTALLKQQTI